MNVTERHGALWNPYGSIAEVSQNITECCWMLQKRYGALQNCSEVLQNVTQCCKALWNVTKLLRNMAGHYG